MNPALANMQQLVAHWQTLQPQKKTKKRSRGNEDQTTRTRPKTQDHGQTSGAYQQQHGTQSRPEQNKSS